MPALILSEWVDNQCIRRLVRAGASIRGHTYSLVVRAILFLLHGGHRVRTCCTGTCALRARGFIDNALRARPWA